MDSSLDPYDFGDIDGDSIPDYSSSRTPEQKIPSEASSPDDYTTLMAMAKNCIGDGNTILFPARYITSKKNHPKAFSVEITDYLDKFILKHGFNGTKVLEMLPNIGLTRQQVRDYIKR